MMLRIGNEIAHSLERRAYSKNRHCERSEAIPSEIASGTACPRNDRLSAIRYPLNAKRGFTLVEVLLAVTILAIGIIGVLRGYATSINALIAGQENIDAVCLLKEKMLEVEQAALEEEGVSYGISGGEFKNRFKDYRWELRVSATDNEELNEAVLAVSHKGKPRKFSLVTYVENKQ